MAYYRIKNITNTLSKRHDSNNKSLAITYNVGFLPKIYTLSVNNEMIISCRKLPVNIHSLRAKGLVTVLEISENEFIKSQRPSAKKKTPTTPLKRMGRTLKEPMAKKNVAIKKTKIIED